MSDEPDFFDASTITPIARDRAFAAPPPRPTLTVLWHPDVTRVGERATIIDGVTGIGRNAPMFSTAGGSRERPLADTCMSRGAALTIKVAGNVVAFEPHPTKAKLAVQGLPLSEPRELEAAALAEGIVITIGERVALCLHLAEPRAQRPPDLDLVGQTDALDAVRREIVRIARTDVPVLIRGKTGTGKELVMRALVARSPRSAGPLVPLDMGRMPGATAASELFGHERGAFTGAVDARSGYFAQADGGTLFLDEIGNTPLDVQAMLLRAVETGEIVPLGSTRRARRVDVRLIAATDADLEARMEDGRFLEPLYRRLSKAEIRIPPLRERRPDIGLLLLHFLRKALAVAEASECLANRGTDAPWLGADEVARLALHAWPGNVRELEAFAGKLVIESEGQTCVTSEDVARLLGERPPSKRIARDVPADAREATAISDEEFRTIFDASKCVPSVVSRRLRIARSTVYDLMTRNGIRTAEQIPDDEVKQAVDACHGNVRQAAMNLRVSHFALAARLGDITPTPPPRRRTSR